MAAAEDTAPSAHCPSVGSPQVAMLLAPRCKQTHTEGQSVACPNTDSLDSTVLSIPHLPPATPWGCHMEPCPCQQVWGNLNCCQGTAVAGEMKMKAEPSDPLLEIRKNKKEKTQAAQSLELRAALPFQDKGESGNRRQHSGLLSHCAAALTESWARRS